MDRFFQKIEKTTSCWFWLSGKDKDGYGKFFLSGKTLQAHRVSWSMHNGVIPTGMSVLHRCDNPPCVNPEHLFVGTCVDNVKDRDAKGRNGCSKRTHGPQGHAYTVENTTVFMGQRKCKTCKKEYDRSLNEGRKAAA